MRHVIGPGRPTARRGQIVGLLGGSFDPPHPGHVHITREALRRFRLDAVWWLVTPGNPLKRRSPADLRRRLEAARTLMSHPHVTVTDLEARLGTRHTAETLEALRAAYPGVRFVWLMGEDNLASVHLWERWPAIFASVPVGVLARPGQHLAARTGRAARLFRPARLPSAWAPCLGRRTPPAWCYLRIPKRAISSTEIRARGEWRS